MPSPSSHIERLGDALSIRWNTRVYELQAAGADITVLSLGEAFFALPVHGLDEHGSGPGLHYSHSRGVPQLRARLAGDYHGVAIDAEREILVTAGSKIAIHMALMTMLDPGDEVVIPEPAWVSYTEQTRLCHGRPVTVPHDVSVAGWERYVTPRTRAIVVNSPNNPSGALLGAEDWARLHDLARRRDLYLLCDEAYSEFVGPGERFVSGGAGDPAKDHTVICNSISKNLGMSGWRIGYVIAAAGFIDQLLKAQQHLVTCAATPLSLYVAEHYDELRDAARPQIRASVRRRSEVIAELDRLGVGFLPGRCTFYVFASLGSSALGSEAFCDRLLAERHVAAVPGVGYGPSCDHFIRISVGTETRERTFSALQAIRALIDETSVVAA
jgi:aspartate/methionine/tyrosine aminotransferase